MNSSFLASVGAQSWIPTLLVAKGFSLGRSLPRPEYRNAPIQREFPEGHSSFLAISRMARGSAAGLHIGAAKPANKWKRRHHAGQEVSL